MRFFKCFCCQKWRLQSKKQMGKVVVRALDGTRELRLCKDCTDGIEQTYESNLKLSELDD